MKGGNQDVSPEENFVPVPWAADWFGIAAHPALCSTHWTPVALQKKLKTSTVTITSRLDFTLLVSVLTHIQQIGASARNSSSKSYMCLHKGTSSDFKWFQEQFWDLSHTFHPQGPPQRLPWLPEDEYYFLAEPWALKRQIHWSLSKDTVTSFCTNTSLNLTNTGMANFGYSGQAILKTSQNTPFVAPLLTWRVFFRQ